MAFRTAAQNISDAMRALGLVSADISNPYAATNEANTLQMTTLLDQLGQDLVDTHAWHHLEKSTTFNTAASTSEYAVVSDFHRLIDGSMWNNDSNLQVIGPVSRQAYQQLLAQSLTLVTNQLFMLVLSSGAYKFLIYPTPTSIQTIGYAYHSAWWMGTDATATTGTRCTAASHVVYFDSLLVVRGLVLYFLRAKGFETTAAQQDFESTLERVKNLDPAPTLSLGGPRPEPLLGAGNIPDTGYGA